MGNKKVFFLGPIWKSMIWTSRMFGWRGWVVRTLFEYCSVDEIIEIWRIFKNSILKKTIWRHIKQMEALIGVKWVILPMFFLLIQLLASLHFYKPQSLQRHIKIHAEEKNICFEFCDMKFWMMKEYKKHLVKHTSELFESFVQSYNR